MTIPVLRRAGGGYGTERAAKCPSEDELRDLVCADADLAIVVGWRAGDGT
jgi:hypothetical protein